MSTPVPPSRRPARIPPTARELVVVARPEAGLRVSGGSVASDAGADVSTLAEILRRAGAAMHPLFGATDAAAGGDTGDGAAPPPARGADLALFYRVRAADAALDALATSLRAHPAIDGAYVKPGVLPALLLEAAAATAAPPAVTPDFTSRQGYLDRAPGGVDARYAWLRPGGQGGNVRIIDVECAWRFTHEDLVQQQRGVVAGIQRDDLGWRNHGTGVLGIVGGDRNAFGVTGICPSALVGASSFDPSQSTAVAVRAAAASLLPGDVLLIENQRDGGRGLIPMEWWPDDYAAIRYATGRGVIVVEAAGNGGRDLGSTVYDVPEPGFPGWWSNPFRRAALDSGAILVGAGAPPPGTHGNYAMGPDRSRLEFSNYGPCVDAQGWGFEVTTCGTGDLQGGPGEDRWYTDGFNGTSSASPIVVGAVACLQGALRGAGMAALTPGEMRALLRATGSPQQDTAGRPASQRIGSRPDLRQMIDRLLVPSETVPLYRYFHPAAGDHFYTTDFNELRYGSLGFGYEGVQCRVYAQQKPGTVPLHRYYNHAATDHFYTTSPAELEADAHGYVHERVQCWVAAQPQPGTVPLYRYYNAAVVDHFYTTAWDELRWGALGSWTFERTECHVYPAPVAAAGATANPAAAAEPVGAV